MLAGYLPFYNSTGKKDIDDKIMTARYKMPDFMKNSNVRTLIESFLVVDPVKRITLDKVLFHPWIKRYLPTTLPFGKMDEIDENALTYLTNIGYARADVLVALANEEASERTATYHLLVLAVCSQKALKRELEERL